MTDLQGGERMAKKDKIKGITIEINGDVTQLDKALRSVDDSLKKTKSDLKDVEKKLKIDPKNVILLTQKQKLLTESVDETKKRYETLKQALENATADDDKYEQWISIQRTLQKELDETNSDVKALEAEVTRVEDLGFAPDPAFLGRYQAELEEARERAASLQQQMAQTYDELGRPIPTKSYDALQREFIQTADDLEKVTKAMDAFSVEGAQAEASFKAFAGTMDGVSSKAKSVSTNMAPVTAGITAIGAAALATVPATDQLRTGLSMLEANAQQAGVSMSTVEDAFRRFNGVSGDTDASIEAISNLLNAGLDDNSLLRAVDELSGAVISFPETLKIESLADSLQETVATGAATGQFGELLERLGINLDQFNAQLAQAPTETARYTLALQELSRNGLGELYKGWEQNNQGLLDNRDATLDFQLAMSQLAQVVLPIVTAITEAVSKLVTWFTDLPEGVKVAIGVIAALVALISPVAGIVASIATALGGFATASAAASAASGALSLSLGSWIAIIAAVSAAVAGLIALLNLLFGKKDDVENMDVGSLTDGGSPSGGGRRSGPGGYPGFASGGVFEPNSPMLGVLGDNKTEREVAAPESTLEEIFGRVASRMGGGGATTVNVRFTGSLSQLGRVLGPVITAETIRQGPSLNPKI